MTIANYDTQLARALYDAGTLGYLQLKRTVEREEYLNHTISFSTYYHHLKALEKAGYLSIKSAKGKKSDMRLTYHGRQDVALRIFGTNNLSHSRVKNSAHLKHPEREKLKAYQLLLYLSTSDYLYWRSRKKGISVQDVLDSRHSGVAYSHLFLRKRVVQESFRLLEREKILKRTVNDTQPSGDKRMFDFVDVALKDFTRDLS